MNKLKKNAMIIITILNVLLKITPKLILKNLILLSFVDFVQEDIEMKNAYIKKSLKINIIKLENKKKKKLLKKEKKALKKNAYIYLIKISLIIIIM